ncbi:hypothetical protein ACFVSW_21545 [Neobacillus sp. NPDC058068]
MNGKWYYFDKNGVMP